MIYPPIKDLLKKSEDKYTLAVMVAKRARQLVAGDKKLVDVDSDNPVVVAINEINGGKITFERTKVGIK
ncbi:DNA-directed RNA polymerase subunit omega [Caldanaerobius fijiensis DSM 17918]|uniref:DNA-directed RNA polymerase subunit omega n=1 Tax=Caldanaerobius fijiensis DSM 17918 TaxID=1121256 RepID=A0A1M4ZQ08_9THEO|nr:DNA-directed RNA polymerase subunit omega [Caldanaerobius fijiensis]SHF20088.1 DNA-directed RNA polymerase subunit omega [Caldanaerobius fijiensis DSM 17918]